MSLLYSRRCRAYNTSQSNSSVILRASGKRRAHCFPIPRSGELYPSLRHTFILEEEYMVKRHHRILVAFLGIAGVAIPLSGQANTFIQRYQARVSATQAEQPHWV